MVRSSENSFKSRYTTLVHLRVNGDTGRSERASKAEGKGGAEDVGLAPGFDKIKVKESR